MKDRREAGATYGMPASARASVAPPGRQPHLSGLEQVRSVRGKVTAAVHAGSRRGTVVTLARPPRSSQSVVTRPASAIRFSVAASDGVRDHH